jgi:vacuolar protein sorting-associated protein 13B
MRAHIRFKSRVSAHLTDYAFLASHYVIDPARFQGQISYCAARDENSLDVNIHSKPIGMRFGHFANHTLDVASRVWTAALDPNYDHLADGRERDLDPFTQFVICNSTQEPVRFGQADTEENQLLKPTEATMYAWRSPKARLLMRVCVEGGYWRWCDPFSLSVGGSSSNNNGVTVIRSIDHGAQNSTLVITVRRVKSTQYQVLIYGLLTTASLIKDHLELRVIMKKSNEQQLEERRTVLGSFTAAPSFVVEPDRVQGVKIRLLGIGTPWSGEIPLHVDKGRKNSVLVRIPTKEKGMCITVWCRLVEETHGGGIRRCLLLFSPMYMARSLLPNPMKVLVSSSSTTTSSSSSTVRSAPVQVQLPGREKAVQLETLGPSDLKYSIAFQVVDNLPPSDPIAMSWGIIEQVREREESTPAKTIDDLVREISSYGEEESANSRWPYIATANAANVASWLPSEQPKTDVQVNFTQFHPLCNTLCVDVNPWCLVVNSLGVTLLLKDEDSGVVFRVDNDSVLVPPQLNSTFYFGIGEEDKVAYSPPLRISDQVRSNAPCIGMIFRF